MTAILAHRGALPQDWDSLNRLLPLRPIRGAAAHRRAQKVMNALAILDRRTRDQEDYLDALTTLCEAYQDQHEAIDNSDLAPLDIVRQLLEEHGMNGSDLGRLLGCREVGSMILSGRRQLSKSHIAKLSAHFSVGPELFLPPTRAAATGRAATASAKPARASRAAHSRPAHSPRAIAPSMGD